MTGRYAHSKGGPKTIKDITKDVKKHLSTKKTSAIAGLVLGTIGALAISIFSPTLGSLIINRVIIPQSTAKPGTFLGFKIKRKVVGRSSKVVPFTPEVAGDIQKIKKQEKIANYVQNTVFSTNNKVETKRKKAS